MKALTTLFILVLALQVRADLLTETFSTSAQNTSATTAVWNIALGIVHPGLQVSGYQVGAQPVVSGTDFSVGDGSDGAFNSTTYSNFGTVSGSTIIVNAISKPVLNVTSFQLDSGDTLTAINGPLVIYSQSTVRIDGTIDCAGINGTDGTLGTGGTFGIGVCGGSNGGIGGNATVSGTQGSPVSGTVTGGFPGQYFNIAPGAGGGGGSAYSGNDGANGTNSTPSTNLGGTGGAGSTGANHDFTNLNGSPGGGGGSGSSTDGGGGGGGGGGTVVIHAVGNVEITSTGLITARGGQGGSSNSGGGNGSGGGGGGGGGGSVKIFTAGNLELNTGTDIDVTGGAGGTPVSGTAGPGGTGSFGRTWLNYTTFSGGGTESHGSLLTQIGTIEYNTVSQTVVSKAYDVSSTTVLYNSASTDVTSADIGIEVAGSTDNFSSNDTGWQPLVNLSTLNSHRYFKFRITLANSNATTPTIFSDFTVDYNPNPAPSPGPSPGPAPGPSPSPSPSGSSVTNTETYQFSGGCGTLKVDDDDKSGPTAIIIFSLLLLPLLASLSLRSQKMDTAEN